MKNNIPFLKSTNFWRDNYLFLRELKYFPAVLTLAIVCTLISAILQGIGLGFVLTFLQSLTEPDAPPFQLGIDWIDTYILGINLSQIDRIYRISGVLFITTILQALFTSLSIIYSGIAQSKLILQIQKRIFEQFQALNLSYFTKTKSGDLINTITAEVSQLRNIFDTISFMIVRGSILGIYAISMLWISWQLTIVVVILFTLTALLISKLFTIIREVSFKTTKARSEYTSRAIEFINGIRTIKVSVAEDFERRKIDQSAFDVFTTEKESWFTKAIVEPIPEALSVILVLGILIFCFEFLIPAGKLQIASLLTLLFIIVRTLPIVRQLNSARGTVNQHQGAVRATKKLLEPQGKPFFENGYREFRGLEREIVFDGVDFAYNPDSLVLKNINLSIKCGEMVALVGASGAGKTTLADLLPRFYDPTGGKILVDGVDLRSLEIDSWRSKMSVVSQDTFIFNTSVRENIAYGLDDVPEETIIEAARQANALEFIEQLSNGFDSVLGDRGVLLSGGQRQRIAIARALLRNPQILILDEATSALDSITERLIQESIEQLAVGRTVIAIAHRLSTIARADKIVVLEKGQIVEEGTYQELLDKKEQFWQYHQMQK